MKTEVKLQLRTDTDIRDWLAAYAKSENRSMNGQINELIQEKRRQVEEAANAHH